MPSRASFDLLSHGACPQEQLLWCPFLKVAAFTDGSDQWLPIHLCPTRDMYCKALSQFAFPLGLLDQPDNGVESYICQ